MYTENYGKISSLGMDPIEKKPLYHFYPGSEILSAGTFGCNFSCDYCQNWQISQERPQLKDVSPDQLVKVAEERNAMGIAYTYSEPSIWYEYVKETAEKASEANLKNVMVTNGFISLEPLKELLPYLDAANVDLKAFDNEFYHKLCGGKLDPVLRNIEYLFKNNVHLELTTLVITDYNDSRDELKELFSWIHDLSPDIPLHISRYFPRYKLDKPPTDVEKMKEAYKVAQEYLNYVYIGNVNLEEGSNTICPECGYRVIERNFYNSRGFLEDGECPECGKEIYGAF